MLRFNRRSGMNNRQMLWLESTASPLTNRRRRVQEKHRINEKCVLSFTSTKDSSSSLAIYLKVNFSRSSSSSFQQLQLTPTLTGTSTIEVRYTRTRFAILTCFDSSCTHFSHRLILLAPRQLRRPACMYSFTRRVLQEDKDQVMTRS